MFIIKHLTHSFAISGLQNLAIGTGEENFIFWLFFIAFAIKMPVFLFIHGNLIPTSNHQQQLQWC
jgi:NADH:ubiquinone oxidoreductase subunit 4 (subunit M)